MESPEQLLKRIAINKDIFNGKPIVRGKRLAVEHVLSLLAAGESPQTLLEEYDFLEPEDKSACLVYATRVVGNEGIYPDFES